MLAEYVLWYYTPMALPFTHGLAPAAVVYDCMDELSAFAGAPPELTSARTRAASGAPTWCSPAARRSTRPSARSHHNVHAFPSSVDVAHFARARAASRRARPIRRAFPRPRARLLRRHRRAHGLRPAARRRRGAARLADRPGRAGREDRSGRAAARAPTSTISGPKTYEELPVVHRGLGRGDAAVRAQRRDALHQPDQDAGIPGGGKAGRLDVDSRRRPALRRAGLARIADTVDEFVAAVDAALAEDPRDRLRAADAFLTQMSWDGTWLRMRQLIEQAIAGSQTARARPARAAAS